MATAEEIFSSTKLEVIVPEEPLEIPIGPIADDWLRSLANVKQRDKAFFDERLLLLFTIKVPHTVVPSAPSPPLELARFLSRLQITLDAKYIAQQQPQQHRGLRHASRGISLVPPPRSHSHRNGSRLPAGPQLSIFPPHTPYPTPQTDEADRKYANSSAKEGTVLESFVWGETQRENSMERTFTVLSSSDETAWVVVYRLNIGVSFLHTPVPEPLLSLTVSATLREKPLKTTPERRILAELVESAGGGQSTSGAAAVAVNGASEQTIQEDECSGLEEVNLLDGLSQGPTFGGSNGFSLTLPSVRLGASLRRSAYSLPPIQPALAEPSSPSASGAHTHHNNNPILRKSFLKTLQTVSGFQIRMKSVFVPYVVISGSIEDEDERREAGSEERTVMLSVELGNGSSGRGPGVSGFVVEGVDVTVGGEGATANLIGWGEGGFKTSDAVFPLFLGPVEQFNLLYAISFLRQSGNDDIADTMRSDAAGGRMDSPISKDIQRPVSIVIHGRPYDLVDRPISTSDDATCLFYPTQTFRSRWNCVLDLSSAQNESLFQGFDVTAESPTREALPAPMTPFPASSPKTARLPADKLSMLPQTSMAAVAGSKRHTIDGLREKSHRAVPDPRYRASTSNIRINTNFSAISYMIPPSPGGGGRSTPTHSINAPSSPALPQTPDMQLPPATPAYPAYSSEVLPQTPASQSPISSLHTAGGAGPMVEPRRERMVIQGGTPQTPGPRMIGMPITDRTTSQNLDDDEDPVVVSVGLIPHGESALSGLDIFYTLETFGIDIFIFNRSERTRRFEVSYPERKRRRHQSAATDLPAKGNTRSNLTPGILPLENRIRIGPLRPYTCQSVRMQFLALQPGVHSIHSLILTDVETGYSKSLKSAMDIVIYDEG